MRHEDTGLRWRPAAEAMRRARMAGATRGIIAAMSAVRAELSSITSTLSDVSRRVTALAEQARDDGDADLAAELFSVERGLAGALRRLERAASEERRG